MLLNSTLRLGTLANLLAINALLRKGVEIRYKPRLQRYVSDAHVVNLLSRMKLESISNTWVRHMDPNNAKREDLSEGQTYSNFNWQHCIIREFRSHISLSLQKRGRIQTGLCCGRQKSLQ